MSRLRRGKRTAVVLGGASQRAVGYTYGADLITNGGFESAGGGGADVFLWWLETAGTGGTIEADAVQFHAGAKSAKQTGGATTHTNYLRSAVLTVTPGQMYLLRRWLRGDGTNDGKYSIYDSSHSAYLKNLMINRAVAAGWVQRDTLFIPPAGCTSVQLFFFAPPVVGGYVNVDDVSLYTWRPPTYFWDNFQRADGDLGCSPGGFPYDLQNTAGKPYMTITSNVLDIPDTVTGYWYSFVDLPSAAKSMRARFRWKDNGADIGDSVVMACSNNSLKLRAYQHMLHFYVLTNQWVFQTVNDSGVFSTLQSGELNLSAGVEYEIGMIVNGNSVTLTIPTIAPVTITDASIGSYAGQFVYYELIRSVEGRKSGVFTYVEARY